MALLVPPSSIQVLFEYYPSQYYTRIVFIVISPLTIPIKDVYTYILVLFVLIWQKQRSHLKYKSYLYPFCPRQRGSIQKGATTRIYICVIWLVVFYVPSTARSFRDSTPIYCPLRKMWSSVNTPFPTRIENPGLSRGSLLHYRCATQAPLHMCCENIFITSIVNHEMSHLVLPHW